jgi:tetratricopeptide (TPR) repeat protein
MSKNEKQPFARRVIDEMLDGETAQQVAEQEAAVAANPDWAEGYYQLAQLYRVHRYQQDKAKRLLLTAIEKKPSLAQAHIALGEIYIAEGDLERARDHAQFAARFGDRRLLEQMKRHGAAGEGGG